MSERVTLKGKPFILENGTDIVVVRAPAGTDPSVFDGLSLSDLVEDEKQITKQLSIAYFAGEETGFSRVIPSSSYTYVEKHSLKPSSSKVTRLEKPKMIPPTGLGVNSLPFAPFLPTKSIPGSREHKKKKKKRSLDEDDEKSPKKKKKSKRSDSM